MRSAAVELTRQGGVAQVRLSQQGKFNAMTRAMWRELRLVFEGIQAASDVRCVLVLGAQGHFCAGGDISEYPSFRFDPTRLHDFHEYDVWGGLQSMLDCDVPIVAQIQGNCIGAGLEIACCCDIRVAGSSARFGAPIAHLGFPMAPREAKLLARELGLATAREMLLSAAVLDAPKMLASGFLNHVYEDQDVAKQAQALIQRITALAPRAARMNKQTLRAMQLQSQSADAGGDSLNFSAKISHPAYRYAASVEHREGIDAFLQKRKPVF